MSVSLLGSHINRVEAAEGTVIGSVVNIRSGPGTQYSVAGSLYQGTTVAVVSQNGDWYYIKCGSSTGWLHKSLLEVAESDAAIEIAVSKDKVNLRSGPATTYGIVGEANSGDVLTLIDIEGEWYKVKTSSGKLAYIRSDMTYPVNSSKPGTDANGDNNTVPVSAISAAGRSPVILLDGQIMDFEVSPRIENNRVLVPLRAIFEALGAEVNWNQATLTATATLGAQKVVLPLNSISPTVNGTVWTLDVPAKVVNQSTLAPLRFVGEALGGTASWDGNNNRVILTSPKDNQGEVVAVVITADTVNLRSEPLVNSNNLVGSANYGERFEVVDESKGWYAVKRNGQKVWIAGWLVDVVREGEPSAAPETSPVVEPTKPSTVTLVGVTITSERTAEGLRIIMESGQKLSPVIDEYSDRVVYKFSNRKIEGPATVEKYLFSDKLSVAGSNSGTSAVVEVRFPLGIKYEISSENSGKKEIFGVPNYIAGVNRKTFGSSGENITINTIAPIDYISTPTSNKLEVVFKDCLRGKAQTSYKYSSSLISSMSFREQTEGSLTKTVLTITTSKAAKFAVGTSDDGSSMNILFVDKSIIESRTPIVVLDAGHGGRDPGASGDVLAEKEINLKVVQKAGKILTAKGVKVVYTRQDDSYVGLDERTVMANLLNAALFVSIHQNANVSSIPSGTETYCYYPLSDPNLYLQKEERKDLALRLQQALVDELGRIDRGVKQGNLAVLRESEMPSALVEMVFISNPEEEKLLQKDSFLDLGARAIAEAIHSYVKSYVK